MILSNNMTTIQSHPKICIYQGQELPKAWGISKECSEQVGHALTLTYKVEIPARSRRTVYTKAQNALFSGHTAWISGLTSLALIG